jgi:hypothetical protein
MHSPQEMELHAGSVQVTWCACASCNSVGPRILTLVQHDHVHTFHLTAACCAPELEDALVSSEGEYSRRRPRLRNHIAF